MSEPSKNRASIELEPRSGRGRRRHSQDTDSELISAATRADILTAAESEFATHGFDGANIVEIARRTSTSKRMIYYHFANKRGLYQAVVQEAYASLRREGVFDNTDGLPPLAALREYAERTFESHLRHPNLVRLSLYENISGAETLRDLRGAIGDYPSNLEPLEEILKAGQDDGTIRSGLRLIDVYLLVVGISFHTISNAHSIKALFGHDMLATPEVDQRRAMIGDMVCRYVATPEGLHAHAPETVGPDA